MSTRSLCPDQESLVSYIYDEFDGSEAFDRRSIARHLDGCDRCTREVASLGGVRGHLKAWQAPETLLAFRIVQDPPHQHAGRNALWAGLMKPAFPLAAAAVLVLGAALGLARLDIQYDSSGFRVRTGWSRDYGAAVAGRNGQTLVNTPISAAGTSPLSPVTRENRSPWQADLQALAAGLRQEMASTIRPTAAATAATGTNASDQALLRKLQQIIDQSEVRQQQNLDLRISELSRQFDVQRQSDLAQIRLGFGQLAGQREVDAQQQRLLLNAIRTSQQLPPK
jgi:hypothetical protein